MKGDIIMKSTEEKPRYIMVPVYSEEQNEDGGYDILSYRKEYVD
jgi:hypothetical protein